MKKKRKVSVLVAPNQFAAILSTIAADVASAKQVPIKPKAP